MKIVHVTFNESGWEHAANLGELFADWKIIGETTMSYSFRSKTAFVQFCAKLYQLSLTVTINFQ